MANIINGSNLMFFYKDNEQYYSIAYATSCSVELSAETTETTSKDHTGGWSSSVIKKLSWTGTSENLYADGLTNGFEKMYDAMVTKKPIEIYFTSKSETEYSNNTWTKDENATAYVGNVLITSLSANASDGENATFSVSFTGDGPLEKKTKQLE